ncbi:hypothetical protein B0H14DRAFT_2881048 [Mycena olivaceomarginata]|nr:hypothetical protein B0H14DRAFT_2881048 [Mycena olivaceomarginata]
MTSLDFWVDSAAAATSVFHLLPKLQYLVFHVAHTFFDASVNPRAVPVTAHLRCLILNDYVDILHYVTISTLEHLGATIWSVQGSDAIVSFVARSRCVLTRLTLLNSFVHPTNGRLFFQWPRQFPLSNSSAYRSLKARTASFHQIVPFPV